MMEGSEVKPYMSWNARTSEPKGDRGLKNDDGG